MPDTPTTPSQGMGLNMNALTGGSTPNTTPNTGGLNMSALSAPAMQGTAVANVNPTSAPATNGQVQGNGQAEGNGQPQGIAPTPQTGENPPKTDETEKESGGFFAKLFGGKKKKEDPHAQAEKNRQKRKEAAASEGMVYSGKGALAETGKKQHDKPQSMGGKILMILFLIGVGFVCVIGNQYFKQSAQNIVSPEFMEYMAMYEDYESMITEYIPISNFPAYDILPKEGPTVNSSIQQVIHADDINFAHKKRILREIFANLGKETVKIQNNIDTTKQEIAKYGFFHKELYDVLEVDDTKISLQRSLLSLEIIKFATALKVFGLLDTFIQQFSRHYNIKKDELEKIMRFYTKRAEADITHYLQSCYLNPFEDLKTCSYVGDFDNYYDFFEPETNIKPELFKSLFSFIDTKLTDTDYPSLAITFDKFNPNSQNLSFKVAVNTFQADERELINKGILNPHIFIVTNIINLLKQSKFIVGESIDIPNMNIKTSEVDIGGKKFKVHNSTRSFNLPLQKPTQREIFDYVPTAKKEVPSLLEEEFTIDLEEFGNENLSTADIVEENPTPEASTGSIDNVVQTGAISASGSTSLSGTFASGTTTIIQ